MFPSSNSTNTCDNPFECLFKKSFSCDQNPISKQDHDPPIFSNFPSPFFDEHELPLNQMLTHNLCFSTSHESNNLDSSDEPKSKEKPPEPNPSPVLAPARRRSLGAVPRNNRTGKKDRHSKICTAQGVRDRRMRLSLEVARKFFDLQDLLGYDKASKTIEWLFSKSKKAIKELVGDHPNEEAKNYAVIDTKSESFVSECEVLSGIEEISNAQAKESKVPLSVNKKGERKSRKTTSKSNVRESRDEARARARWRTREKMMMRRLEILSRPWNVSHPNYTDNEKLGYSNSTFQEPNSHCQGRVSLYSGECQNIPYVGTIENLPSSNPDDLQCSAAVVSSRTEICSNVLGFLGHWDLVNNEKTSTIQGSFVSNPNSIFLASPNFPFHQ